MSLVKIKQKLMHGILRCTYTDFFIIKSIGLLDNHLSGSSISHLHDVDTLLEVAYLHTIDGIDICFNVNWYVDIFDVGFDVFYDVAEVHPTICIFV